MNGIAYDQASESRLVGVVEGQVDVMVIETDRARLAINPPRSRLARAFWHWLGIDWTVKNGTTA